MPSRRTCAAMLGGLVWAAASSAQPLSELEMPSCVRGSPPLRLPAAAERAVLDTADRHLFQEAAQARYALYQRGGQVPAHVLMIRRGGHWQYVTLWHGGSSGPCVSAVFAADRFDFTPGWLAKYKPRARETAD